MNPGISALQGGQRIAQKSRMTIFPLYDDKEIVFPSRVGSVKSGAGALWAARIDAPAKMAAMASIRIRCMWILLQVDLRAQAGHPSEA